MGAKIQAQKFEHINKASLKIPAGHTRTGACTSSGRCFHKVRRVPKGSKG